MSTEANMVQILSTCITQKMYFKVSSRKYSYKDMFTITISIRNSTSKNKTF